MKRSKESLQFALVFYSSIIFFNAITWHIIELVPFLFHGSYPFYELQGAILLIYIPIVFLFSLLININRLWIYFPLIYLVISLIIILSNPLEGWDLILLLDFGISQASQVVYELIGKTGFLEGSILNLILFNMIFMIYQVFLLYLAYRLLKKINK
ncbi:MAG: hypothetical protein ACPGSD_05030 [Flavobacteriales bacterium]